MFAYEQCRSYLKYLNEQDLPGVLSLFTPGASVTAPLLGTRSVRDFHENLFRKTDRSVARLTNVFTSLGRANATALQFHYLWVFSAGTAVEFDGISVFEMSDDSVGLIERLTIIYDPSTISKYVKTPAVQQTQALVESN